MEQVRTTTDRRMSCECCRRYGSDHRPDEAEVRDDQAMAWFAHARKHHRGRVRVERRDRWGWVTIEELDA